MTDYAVVCFREPVVDRLAAAAKPGAIAALAVNHSASWRD